MTGEKDQHEQRTPPRHARACLDDILRRMRGKRLVVFLDYDGTLTPIVRRPEQATLADSMRDVIRALARQGPVAIISGRDRAVVEQLVRVPGLVYAGSHGFDISGPGGMRKEHPGGRQLLGELDAVEEELARSLTGVQGILVERKRFAVAVHTRMVPAPDVERVERIVAAVGLRHPRLLQRPGKKVLELRPNVEWDKGRAVRWILEHLGLGGKDVLPLYIGDDDTDEDAFRSLAGDGIGIRVGEGNQPTRATYFLHGPPDVELFLLGVMNDRRKPRKPDGSLHVDCPGPSGGRE
ncbi:MAG: trehalose-phosphatase [Acidobacteriota bacterium]